MRIVGLIRVRNAEDLIEDSLNHMSQFVDAIYVFDDASTDNTYEIAKKHPFVKEIVRSNVQGIKKTGFTIEGEQRNKILQVAKRKGKPDWCLYMDVDERFEPIFARKKLERIIEKNSPDVITFDLYDFYVTPLDNKKNFQNILEDRQYFGPEFRRILFFFRATKKSKYLPGDIREPFVKKSNELKIFKSTYKVYHYGKGLTEKAWDEKCKFNMHYFPQYYLKWKRRIGKFVHTKSDFGRELYTKENFSLDKAVMLHDYRPIDEKNKVMLILKFLFKKAFRIIIKKINPQFEKYIKSVQNIVFWGPLPRSLEDSLDYKTGTLNIEILKENKLSLRILFKIIKSDALIVCNFAENRALKFILMVLRIPTFVFFNERFSKSVLPIGILVNDKEQESKLIEKYKYTENDILVYPDSSINDIILFLRAKMYCYKYLL